MERLNENELVLIAQKVVEYGTQHLFSFMRTSREHARIFKLPVVLRVLPTGHVTLFNIDEITSHQQNFLNMMIESGHTDYCMLHGVNELHELEPDLTEIRRVLNIASIAGVETADYFLMLLDASAKGEREG